MTTQTIDIALNGTFNAAELEEIIHEFAKARSSLLPPVPSSIEGASLANANTLVERSPSFTFATLADGGLRIHIRSSGFGWLAFTLSAAERAHVGKLITGEHTHTHRPH